MEKWIDGEINTVEELEMACDVFTSVIDKDLEPIQKLVHFKQFIKDEYKMNLPIATYEEVIFRKIYAPQHFL